MLVIWASTRENLSSEASAQTDQRFCFLESIISKLPWAKFSNLKIVSVAEESGFSLALSETPKTGFLASQPIYHLVIAPSS